MERMTVDGRKEAREGGVRTIEDLQGPAGRLEALLNPSRLAGEVPAAVVLCHPHPLFGGTLHNKVVYHAMKSFTEAGLPVLRFNFRGAGRSEGEHDFGLGEQEDVLAAVDWLHAAYGLPMIAAGFSFGAHTALCAGCRDPRITGLVSLGTPIMAGDRVYAYDFLAGCAKPKLFVSGSADEFGPMARIDEALSPAEEPKQVVWITAADHFFVGKLDLMQSALRAWLQVHFVPLLTPDAVREGSRL